MLSVPMDAEPNVLAEQLRNCESLYARITSLAAFTDAFIDGATSEAWRTAKGTVPEKEAWVRGETAQQRRLSNVLSGLCRAISQRISLGQSLLRKLEADRPRP